MKSIEFCIKQHIDKVQDMPLSRLNLYVAKLVPINEFIF